jgi:hypothetical protein
MARPLIKQEGGKTSPSRTDRRRTAHARLARLDQEFKAELAQRQKSRSLEAGLVAASIVAAVLGITVLVQSAPTCGSSTAPPAILIGGAIKVAGC